MDKLAWLLQDNKEFQREEGKRIEAEITAKYGKRCERCHWPINHPLINYPYLKWCKKGEHDCFTGDPLAR
jgi:hypothetical protein